LKKTHRQCGDRLARAMAPMLFEFDRLVFSGFVKRRSPDFVRSLMFTAAETE
jgi:hypothetical protein